MLTQKSRLLAAFVLFICTSCKSADQNNEVFEAPAGKGAPWAFSGCSKQVLNGTELVQMPTDYKIYVQTKLDGDNLEVIFTNEFLEEYTLKSATPRATAKGRRWSGETKLTNSIDQLDSQPLKLAYEVETDDKGQTVLEVITTKSRVPAAYNEDDVKTSYDVNKFTSRGDSLTMVLMEKTKPGYDYEVSRVCGKGFSKSADAKRQPAGDEFSAEVSL